MIVRRAAMPIVIAVATAGLPAMPLTAQQAPAPATIGVEAAWLTPPPRPDLRFDAQRVPDRAAVIRAMDYVAAAQIADMSRRPIALATGSALHETGSNWVAATFYVGAARLARLSERPETLRFLTAVAEHYNYGLRGARSGRTLLNADDVAIGDLYAELYARRRQEGVLMPLQQRLDYAVPHLGRQAAAGDPLIWWWCDALFMAPPVLARLSALTGDPKYLRAMDAEWRRTAARLWSPDHRLFYRDARFVDRRSPAGRPVMWARGNGWVLAGLARTIEAMPATFDGRGFYVDLYRTLATRIVELQRPDGLWRSSLLDPDAFPEPETSGSALLTYGLAWGINHGLLPRARFERAATRGWAALNRHVLPSGLIGAAQKTGDQPVPTQADEVGLYATGGYLLAGSEMAGLRAATRSLPEAQPARDDDATILATTPQPPPPVTVNSPAERSRRAAEVQATQALAYDPAAAGRPSAIEPLAPPAGDDRRPRAIAYHAPERSDDILWENDRVAFRIYGPALEAREPPSGSGIDIWGKRVRWPFMRRQLTFPNYHIDRGEGLDFYDVGGGRGGGGLGIWQDNKLWTSRNWATHRILATGGDRASFTVTYKPFPVDVGRKVWEERRFDLPMGSNFTKMTSTLGSDTPDPLVVAIGIGKRTGGGAKGQVVRDGARGLLTFHEPANAAHGALSMTVAVDPKAFQGFAEDANNYLILVRATPGVPFTYYSGAGWDRGLDFTDAAAWDRYVAATRFDFAHR